MRRASSIATSKKTNSKNASNECSNFLIHAFFYLFSAFGKDESNYIDLSGLQNWWNERDTLVQVFSRAGFAKSTLGRYKLRPCSLGTFVNSSVSDPNGFKCFECPAGKLCFKWCNNGYATSFFELERGVKQGCPLNGVLL